VRKSPSVQSAAERLRRPTNVSLDRKLLAEARELGINLSRACEHGLARAIVDARAQRWLAENEEALNSSNDYIERHGLPLARYRMF